MRTLDRYVLREILPPFVLALLIFTFLLVMPPVMEYLENLLAKGVTWGTAARILVTLVPQALGLTIPMAVLVGILIGLGRMSADRESMALLACGVSPYRILRPIGLFAGLAALATGYVMIVAIPDANQMFREITFSSRVSEGRDRHPAANLLSGLSRLGALRGRRARPGPDRLEEAHGREHEPGRGNDHVLCRTRAAGRRPDQANGRPGPRQRHQLSNRPSRRPGPANRFTLVSGAGPGPEPGSGIPENQHPEGVNEKTIAELRVDGEEKVRTGHSKHPEVMAIQQKFSFPVACLVFAVIGVALGMTVAREGKLAGFVVGTAVIFAYYIVMFLCESLTKGHYVNMYLSRWVPNIVLGLFGVVALIWRARYVEGRLPFKIPVASREPRCHGFASGRGRRGGQTAAPGTTAADGASSQPPAGPPGRRPPVLVIRIPRLRLPAPGLLDRYISRMYLRIVGLSFLALLGLFYISTFLDKSDKIFKGQATTAEVLTLLVYMTPRFIYYVIPISALLSVLVTFGLLSRNSELTVMKACGVSLYRASLAVVLLSLVFSATIFGLEQRVLARSNRKAEVIDAKIRGRTPRVFDAMNRQWVVGREGAIYHYLYFNPERKELAALTIYQPRTDKWDLATATSAETPITAAAGSAGAFESGTSPLQPRNGPSPRNIHSARTAGLLRERTARRGNDDRRCSCGGTSTSWRRAVSTSAISRSSCSTSSRFRS